MQFLPACSNLPSTSNMHSSFVYCHRQFSLALIQFWPVSMYLLWKVNPQKILSVFCLGLVLHLGAGFSRGPIWGSVFFWGLVFADTEVCFSPEFWYRGSVFFWCPSHGPSLVSRKSKRAQVHFIILNIKMKG